LHGPVIVMRWVQPAMFASAITSARADDR